MVKKTWYLRLEIQIYYEIKATSKTVISQLEAKIKGLKAEKEILNRVIDIADKTMNVGIRKKHLPLLQEASKAQRQNPDTPSS